MKKLILFLLAIVLPFAFSSCKEETPTEEEVLLEGIKCLDKEMNDIERILYETKQTEYVYKDIYVYAYYSDGSSGDVTAFVTFSNVDLTTSGEKEVTVSYKGFSDKFIIDVLDTSLNRIEINTTNCRKIYSVGEELDLSNLKVFAFYNTDKKEEIDNYTVAVYDEYDLDVSGAFKRTGQHRVVIKFDSNFDYFYVYVYEEYNEIINVDYSNLELDINGAYEYGTNEYIFEKEEYSFMSSSTITLNTKNVSNNYFNNEFKYKLTIDEEHGLIFNVSKSFNMMLIIEGVDVDTFIITDLNDNIVEYFIEKYDGYSIVCFSGMNSVYNIKNASITNIIGMLLSIEETKVVQEFVVDTKNVKKTFTTDDQFSYAGLDIKIKIGTDSYLDIPLDECEINLYKNGILVNHFSSIGVYKVEIKYNDGINQFEYSYDIMVEKKVIDYSYIELNLQNVQTAFETNQKFNYDYLVVYGCFDEESKTILKSSEYIVTLYYSDGYNDYEVGDFSNVPGSYFVIVTYNSKTVSLSEKYTVTYDLGVLEYEQTPTVNIEVLENKAIKLDVEKVLDTLINVRFKIYDSNNIIVSVNTLSATITNLEVGKEYTLKGYYTGKIKGQEYIVYLEETIIFIE